MNISDYDYPLPEARIAKFPLENRTDSKLLIYKNGSISERRFADLPDVLPADSLLVFNDTRVVRARLVMHKPSGARVEVFCLEPTEPADYERAFAAVGSCEWSCLVGNAKKWKGGAIKIEHGALKMEAVQVRDNGREKIVRFVWDAPMTFGQLLETLGRIPIPPYLNRESEELDNTRYQTVYARFDGSVAAPTAGLHFTDELIARMPQPVERVTLHVGAGTFLPVKEEDALQHPMHVEHFSVTRQAMQNLLAHVNDITAVGTTSVRTLESLPALAWRILRDQPLDRPVGQWELYDLPADFTGKQALEILIDRMPSDVLHGATQIMIAPRGYRFRIVRNLITNFHQPCSTLLLLVAAWLGGDGTQWKEIYRYALDHDFRFLSYGDSSVYIR